MKIVYVTDQMYLHGGIEKMLSQKINYWIANYGYEVILCTSEQRNQNFVYNLDPRLKHVDLKVNYYREKSYFHPINLFKSVTHFNKLRKVIKTEKPDIIISVNYTPEQFFVPFIEKQIPKIKEFHSSGITIKTPDNFIEKLKHRLFLLLGRYHAQVILNADEKKYYPFQNVHIIPNFIALDVKTTDSVRDKTIIAAGRIAAVKQFDHLIHAWSSIAADFPEWQVKIFGNGDEQLSLQLKELINKLEVPNIYLMGATNHLNLEMQKASLYAMTSATECFPMVLLEAQKAGLPIISYDCPNGPRNIISSNLDGWLTPHNEIDIFAEKLAMLIKNDNERKIMEIAARQNVTQFSSEIVMEQWNELVLKIQA